MDEEGAGHHQRQTTDADEQVERRLETALALSDLRNSVKEGDAARSRLARSMHAEFAKIQVQLAEQRAAAAGEHRVMVTQIEELGGQMLQLNTLLRPLLTRPILNTARILNWATGRSGAFWFNVGVGLAALYLLLTGGTAAALHYLFGVLGK